MQRLRRQAELYRKFDSPEQCAILQSLVEPIVRDTGDVDMLADPFVAQNIARTLSGHFRNLQPKVSMTRWFGLVDASKAYLPRWHRRLLVQLFLCLQTGVFKIGRPSEETLGCGSVRAPSVLQRCRSPMYRATPGKLNAHRISRLLASVSCTLSAAILVQKVRQTLSWRRPVVRIEVACGPYRATACDQKVVLGSARIVMYQSPPPWIERPNLFGSIALPT